MKRLLKLCNIFNKKKYIGKYLLNRILIKKPGKNMYYKIWYVKTSKETHRIIHDLHIL